MRSIAGIEEDDYDPYGDADEDDEDDEEFEDDEDADDGDEKNSRWLPGHVLKKKHVHGTSPRLRSEAPSPIDRERTASDGARRRRSPQ